MLELQLGKLSSTRIEFIVNKKAASMEAAFVLNEILYFCSTKFPFCFIKCICAGDAVRFTLLLD